MSGGSYDYAYARVQSFAEELLRNEDTEPSGDSSALRMQFVQHLYLVARAMQAIEWVDSCDRSPGDENQAILACLASHDSESP